MNKIGLVIDLYEKELIELSLNIHQRPELAFKEYYAADALCTYLKGKGFAIKSGIAGMDTAFIAEFDSGRAGPTVGFIAEYDALPGMGHGCGHNLIATMAVGAAIGLKSAMCDLGGVIRVIGTPAEECGGGKIILCKQGIFDDVDCALMIHPSDSNIIMRGGLATRTMTIEYFGKSAHSASPEDGINAVNAMIQTFNLIDASRALMPTGTNINGMIIKGGMATNIISDYAMCSFSVRGVDVVDLKRVMNVLERVVASVDLLIGTTSKISSGMVYAERYPNKPLAERIKIHLGTLGVPMDYPDLKQKIGSSDIGNVSLQIPIIHSYLKIADDGVKAHSVEFAEASQSEFGLKQMIIGAKALALTGYDVLDNLELQEEMRDYFIKTVPKYKDELQ